MKGRVILLWLFIGAVIVTYLIVKLYVKDYNIANKEMVSERTEMQTKIVKGYDIVNDYNSNIQGIKEHKVDFSITGKTGTPIPFSNAEELDAVLYKLTDYLKIEFENEGVKYISYSVNDYDLLERNVTSKQSYNVDLLAMYLGVDPKTLKKGVEKPRDLLEGEVYGKTVVSTYEGKKDQFEGGILYFILDGEDSFSFDKVKEKVKDNDIYKKEYELDSEGKLVGYTFTKVLE